MKTARRAVTREGPLSSKRELRTYAIRRTGVAMIVDGAEGRELRFPGTISRKDGYTRPYGIVVRATKDRPTLIEDVSKAIESGNQVRMVVAFERINVEANGVTHMRINAVVDNLLDGYRVPDPRQMELFA